MKEFNFLEKTEYDLEYFKEEEKKIEKEFNFKGDSDE